MDERTEHFLKMQQKNQRTNETRAGTNEYSATGEVFSDYRKAAEEIAILVETKQAAYGDSFGKSGAVLRILYPLGIAPNQVDDALTVVRVLDKLFRVATQKEAFGESPWRDILGYALLAVVKDSRRK